MTRYGALALIAGAVSLAIGRVFGVIELFVIGAGFLGAFIMALARVPIAHAARKRRPSRPASYSRRWRNGHCRPTSRASRHDSVDTVSTCTNGYDGRTSATAWRI